MRYVAPMIASAAAAAALLLAPAALLLAPMASADPGLPTCTGTSNGSTFTGTTTTECATPGNVQIDATAPDPVYTYPWDDEFYGPALIIGGDDGGGRR